MINLENIRAVIVKGLRKYLGVEIIRSSTANRLPKLPFCSYTITSVLENVRGTWGRYDDLTDKIPAAQTWSITLNSEDFGECSRLALTAHDYFSKAGVNHLKDNGIVVKSVGVIVPRDNFLSIDYEYRQGFDVSFGLMNELSYENETKADDIEINGHVIKNGGV